MTPAEILAPICSTDETRANLATPFGMVFRCRKWIAASDGHVAVAFLDDAVALRDDAPPLAELLDLEPPPTFRASVEALRSWAGPPEAWDTRYGAIFSGILNRVLLARVLATLPDDTTHVRIGQAEPLAPYILRAKGWLAAIMPVTGEKSAERFTELEAVAA